MFRLLNAGIVADPRLFLGLPAEDTDHFVRALVDEFGVKIEKLDSTFYKSFGKVESMSRFELFLDQIVHYASTYGEVDWIRNSGEIWEPDPLSGEDVAAMTTFANKLVILGTFHSRPQLADAVKGMLYGGLALKEESVKDLLLVSKEPGVELDLAAVKNKEALCLLCAETHGCPEDFDDAVRLSMYYLTGSALLIKSGSLYSRLESKAFDADTLALARGVFEDYAEQRGESAAAQSAQRYRKYLVLLREGSGPEFTRLVNRILRKTKKIYRPLETAPINRVFSTSTTDPEVLGLAASLNNFQLVRLVNAANERLSATSADALYVIRNGKTWVRKGEDKDFDPAGDKKAIERVRWVKTTLMEALVSNLRQLSDAVFVIPENVEYALPTTAKRSAASIPDFSTILVKSDAVVGIAWEIRADLDLHTVDFSGRHFGWNADYQGAAAPTYSGDMTGLNSHGFASEFFRFQKSATGPFVVSVNCFSARGNSEVPFQIVIAGNGSWKAGTTHPSFKGIFDAYTDVRAVVKCSLEAYEQKSFAIVDSDGGTIRVTFADVGRMSNSQVTDPTGARVALKIMKNRAASALKLNELLELVGARVVSSADRLTGEDFHSKKVYDLSTELLNESSFIDILS